MTTYLDAFDKKGRLVKTEEKEVLLNSIKEFSLTTGDAPYAVPAVFLLLVHPQKGIYVVKRAGKSENPYLWCKTVGGNVHHGEDPNYALVRETKEEISTDIIITDSIEDYLVSLHETDLTQIAVARHIDLRPWLGTYRTDRNSGRVWKRRFRAHIYTGVLEKDELVFTSRTEADDFSDGLGEAVELAFYPKRELSALINQGDRRFTHDLSVLVRDYFAFL